MSFLTHVLWLNDHSKNLHTTEWKLWLLTKLLEAGDMCVWVERTLLAISIADFSWCILHYKPASYSIALHNTGMNMNNAYTQNTVHLVVYLFIIPDGDRGVYREHGTPGNNNNNTKILKYKIRPNRPRSTKTSRASPHTREHTSFQCVIFFLSWRRRKKKEEEEEKKIEHSIYIRKRGLYTLRHTKWLMGL